MHPDPPPTPPAGESAAAAAGQGRSRSRGSRPGPPGFTYEVQLLGGDAGRRLAQQQAEAIAAVLAWLAGRPPTPLPQQGPQRPPLTAGRRAAHGNASRNAASPGRARQGSGR